MKDFWPAEHALGWLDRLASHKKTPVIAVVEEEEHLFLWLENGGQKRGSNSFVMGARLLANISEEGVFFITWSDPFEVRVKSVTVIHIKIHRTDDALRQVFQGVS